MKRRPPVTTRKFTNAEREQIVRDTCNPDLDTMDIAEKWGVERIYIVRISVGSKLAHILPDLPRHPRRAARYRPASPCRTCVHYRRPDERRYEEEHPCRLQIPEARYGFLACGCPAFTPTLMPTPNDWDHGQEQSLPEPQREVHGQAVAA